MIVEIDATTGERTERPETQAELDNIAQRQAAESAAAAQASDPTTLENAAKTFINGQDAPIDLRKLIKAVVVSYEAYRLGKAPGALTGAELVAARDRIAAIYKAL